MRRYELSQREFYFKEKGDPLEKVLECVSELEDIRQRHRIWEKDVQECMQYCREEGIQYEKKDIKNWMYLFEESSLANRVKVLRPIMISLVEMLYIKIKRIEATRTRVKLITSKGIIFLLSVSLDYSKEDVEYECRIKLQKNNVQKIVAFDVDEGNVYHCKIVFSETMLNSWNIKVNRDILPKKEYCSTTHNVKVTYNFVCPSWKQEKKVNAYLTSLSAKQLLQVSTVRKIIQMSQCTKQEITFQVERQDHTLPFPLIYYQRKEGKETVYRTRKITILPKEIVRMGSSHAGIYCILTTKGNYYWIEEALFAERRKPVVLNKTLLDALVYEGDRNSIKQIGQVL